MKDKSHFKPYSEFTEQSMPKIPPKYRFNLRSHYYMHNGIALLELALFVPILVLIGTSLVSLGQIFLRSSEIKSLIDESLKSAILSETPNRWPQELETLSSLISQSLNKHSPKDQTQVVISMALMQEGVVTIYNGSFFGINSSDNPNELSGPAANLDIHSTNGELRGIINNLQANQTSPPPLDLTGIAITKVKVRPPEFPLSIGPWFLWPSSFSRIGFLNLKTQF